MTAAANYFKIVQTIENGDLCLSVVPGAWEEKGTLWWPNHLHKAQLGSLLKNPLSIPEKTKWEKLSCIRKRTCKTYKEAEKELRQMSENSDTEGVEMPKQRLTLNRLKHSKEKTFSLIEIPSFNEEIQMILNNQTANTEIEAKTVIDAVSSADNDEQSNVEFNPSFKPVEKQPEPVTNPAESSFLTASQLENLEELNPLESEPDNTLDVTNILNTLLANQEKIIIGMAKLQTQVDALGKIICNSSHYKENIPPTNAESRELFLKKPISSLKELQEFDKNLSDEGFMKKILSDMSFICGSNGKQNGFDCCYKLIDFFLDRNFLTNVSWTGNTRAGPGSTKVALKFFENFRECFLKLIIKGDATFGEKDCDLFFKRILKNSQQRLTAKGNVESKHKSRPRNLQYKKMSGLIKPPEHSGALSGEPTEHDPTEQPNDAYIESE